MEFILLFLIWVLSDIYKKRTLVTDCTINALCTVGLKSLDPQNIFNTKLEKFCYIIYVIEVIFTNL